MTDEQKSICHRAIWHYGDQAQELMAIEEMSELTKEICKDFRNEEDLTHIAEEVADVLICLEQLQMIFTLRDSGFRQKLEDFVEYKLKRLERRMEEDDC